MNKSTRCGKYNKSILTPISTTLCYIYVVYGSSTLVPDGYVYKEPSINGASSIMTKEKKMRKEILKLDLCVMELCRRLTIK